MIAVSLQEAKEKLEELLDKAFAGETIEIHCGERKAKLISDVASERRGALLGSQKGALLYISDDFDAPLDDFKEYMQ